MNILSIPYAHGVGGPQTGGHYRYLSLLSELIKADNQLYVIEASSFRTETHVQNVEIFRFNEPILPLVKTALPRDTNPEFVMLMARILREHRIDLIESVHPSGIAIARIAQALLRRKIPVVYATNDVGVEFVSELVASGGERSKVGDSLRLSYTFLVEWLACRFLASHVTVVSEEDRTEMSRRYGINPDKITVIPSGCTDEQVPNTAKLDLRRAYGLGDDDRIVFFLGSYHHQPNAEAIRCIINEISPFFENRHPRVLFIVAGTGVPLLVERNVRCVGFVPRLQDYLAMADVAIAPLKHGAGTKIKILQYMSAGLPVVTTRKGIRGIHVQDGIEAIVTENVGRDFIDGINFLLQNESARVAVGKNSKSLAERDYGWDKIGRRLNGLYRQLAQSESRQIPFDSAGEQSHY